jgi:hypothetical protein
MEAYDPASLLEVLTVVRSTLLRPFTHSGELARSRLAQTAPTPDTFTRPQELREGSSRRSTTRFSQHPTACGVLAPILGGF